MTIIDPSKSIANPIDLKKQTGPKQDRQEPFATVLRETADAQAVPDDPVEPAAQLPGIRPAHFAMDPVSPRTRMMDDTQRLIDTMETYQHQLTDPQATLKDIQSTIDTLSAQRDALTDETNQSDVPSPLRSVVNQSLSLATMEITRFNNGEYNDQ